MFLPSASLARVPRGPRSQLSTVPALLWHSQCPLSAYPAYSLHHGVTCTRSPRPRQWGGTKLLSVIPSFEGQPATGCCCCCCCCCCCRFRRSDGPRSVNPSICNSGSMQQEHLPCLLQLQPRPPRHRPRSTFGFCSHWCRLNPTLRQHRLISSPGPCSGHQIRLASIAGAIEYAERHQR